jgi:aminoglycoside phosphotransferase (APT) family kinase protein
MCSPFGSATGRKGIYAARVPDWTDPRWLAEVHAWIHAHARVTGAIEQPHVRPWSTVLRAPTADGPVWFKANAPSLAYEARLTSLLAEKRPDAVPALLAADLDRGWMLMADGGERLRDTLERERDLSRWLDVLPLYASLQIDLAPHAEELLRLGVPDRRPAVLAEQAAEVEELRDHLPRIEDLCARLAASGIPDTIQHDDLHDGQVFFRDGRPLVFDWGDAVVSHPFLSMSVTLEGGIDWGVDDIQGSEPLGPYRDAYLAPFERYAPRAELEASLDDALRLGWVSRVLASDSQFDSAERRRARLKMFLQEPIE